MTKTNLNNGVPFSDYNAPAPMMQENLYDAFYASFLPDREIEDPIEMYQAIKTEQESIGKSIILERAKIKWENEKNIGRKQVIEDILADPSISKQEKQKVLIDYGTKDIIPSTLKDKAILDMTNNYILEQNLDNNDIAIEEIDERVGTLKIDQDVEKLKTTITSGKTNDSITEEQFADTILTVAEKVERGIPLKPTGVNIPFVSDWAWFMDMLVGKSPAFIVNTLQILKRKLGVTNITEVIRPAILAQMFPSTTLVDEYAKLVPDEKSWSEVQQEVYSQASLVNEWEDNVASAFEEMGQSREVLESTIPGIIFNKGVGGAIKAISEFVTPDDPAKTAIPLEIGVAVLLPYGAHKAGKGKKPPVDREGHVKATKEQMDAVREANRKSAEAHQKQKIVPQLENKVDLDAPIVNAYKSNPTQGSRIVDAIIADNTGQVGKAAGFESNKLSIYFADPNANIIKNPQFGFKTDVSAANAMMAVNDRSTQILFENPNLSDAAQVAEIAEKTALTLNGIIPKVPMIPSNTQTISSYARTPSGIYQSTIFQKNPSEYYKKDEIVAAFDQVKESILANFAGDEGALRPGELLIQERTLDNNVVVEFTPETMPSMLIDTASYTIKWQPKTTEMYSYFNDLFGGTPSERFPSTKVTDRVQKWIYDSEASASKLGSMNRFFVYGRQSKALEQKVYQTFVSKQAVFDKQKRLLVQATKKELSITEQNQLGVLLEYQDRNGFNQLTEKQIVDALGTVPSTKSMDRLQVAINTFRLYDSAVLAADNNTYINHLLETGYDKTFIKPRNDLTLDPNMLPEIIEVKDVFAIEDKTGAINIFTETGELLSATAWDFTTSTALSFSPELNKTKTHYILGTEGMPVQQVYRLKRNYTDPKTGDIYQYGTFGTLVPQPIPNKVLPERPGHVARRHDESHIIMRIPLRVKINGYPIDSKFKDLFNDIGNTRIINDKSLTKNQIKNRDRVIELLGPFGQGIAMVNSPREAFAWSRDNLPTLDPNYMYVLEKVNELNVTELADYRIREQQSIMGVRRRNTQLDYKVKSDPLETAIENARVVQNAYTTPVILQLKKEWVNTYANDGRLVKIEPNKPAETGLAEGMIESDIIVPSFPLESNIIRAREPGIPRHEEFAKQARADWWLITNKERSSMAVDTKAAILGIRKFANTVADLTQNQKLFAIVSKAARKAQKNPEAVAGSYLTAVTTLQLLVNAPKQFFLQVAAPLANLTAVSKYGLFGLEFYNNVLTTFALAHRYAAVTKQFKGDEAAIRAVNDYIFQNERISKAFENTEFKGVGVKYNSKQLDYIVVNMMDHAISQVGEHIYTQGLLINRTPRLGEGMTLGSIANKGAKLLTDLGFNSGELGSRFGHVISAIAYWEKQNPGKSWMNKKTMAKIMYDSYQLSGSMTTATNVSWQNSLTLRTIGQFRSFMAKITEVSLSPNATPFNFYTRAKVIGWSHLYYGAGWLGGGMALNALLENIDKPWAWKLARVNEYANLFYLLGNGLGDLIFAEDGDRESRSRFGDLYNVYGNDWSFLGPYVMVIESMIDAYNGSLDANNMGAAISWYKRTTTVADEILEIWLRNPEAYKERNLHASMIALGTLFPPTKSWIQYNKEMQANFEIVTKTGHPSGITQTQSEAFFRAFWGVQTNASKYLWEVQTSEYERTKSLDAHSKQFLKIIASTSKGGKPTYYDVAKALSSYILILDNQGFISNSTEHTAFITKVYGLMSRQKSPVIQNFIKKYVSRILTGEKMTVQQVIDARKNIEATYPDPNSEERIHMMNFLNSMDALRNADIIAKEKDKKFNLIDNVNKE